MSLLLSFDVVLEELILHRNCSVPKTNLFCLKLNTLPRTDQLLPLVIRTYFVLTVSLLNAEVFQSSYVETICTQYPFSIQKQFLPSSVEKNRLI